MSRTGFLERWSARKREDAARADAPVAPGPQDAPSPGASPDDTPALSEEAAARMTDAEALAALRLPDPTAMPHGADFSAFLRAGVPRRLQRMALRRLWTVSPEQAALDGLVDYAEDYTDAAVAVQALATTYEAGRGLRAHSDALARAEDDAARGEDGAEDRETAVAAEVPDDSSWEASTTAESPPARPAAAAETVASEEPVHIAAQQHRKCTAASSRKPSRMTFRFDDA